MSKKGPEFTARRDAILVSSSILYRNELEGLPSEEAEASVPVLALSVGSTEKEMQAANREASLVKVAARVIAREAITLDKIDTATNPVSRTAFKIESALGRIVNKTYLQDELGPEGLVAQVRGMTPPQDSL